MNTKLRKTMTLIISLFVGGGILAYLGFTKGEDWATTLSRPRGASAWTTTEGFTLGCTYVPVILGVALILLSVVFSVMVFYRWYSQGE